MHKFLKEKQIIFLLLSMVFLSCSTNESNENNEDIDNKLFITTVEITLTPENGDILTSHNYDADSFEGTNYHGENATTGVGQFNTTYIGTIRFLNERVNPTVDLTNDIIENGLNYQILFGIITGGEPTYSYEYLPPFDTNGKPIGTNFKIYSSDGNCGVISLFLDYGGSFKSIPISGSAHEFDGIIFSGDIIAIANTHVECEL